MGYWDYTPIEELHRRSRMWQSEIAFCKEELSFMRKLVKNHFLYFADEKRIQETNRLSKNLRDLENDMQTVAANIHEHESHLKELMLSKTSAREKEYRKEHGSLEKLMTTFTNDYKEVKKKLFREADQVLQEEKMQRLISMAG